MILDISFRLLFEVVVAERMSGASMYELVSSLHLLFCFFFACFSIPTLFFSVHICLFCRLTSFSFAIASFLFAPSMLGLHLRV